MTLFLFHCFNSLPRTWRLFIFPKLECYCDALCVRCAWQPPHGIGGSIKVVTLVVYTDFTTFALCIIAKRRNVDSLSQSMTAEPWWAWLEPSVSANGTAPSVYRECLFKDWYNANYGKESCIVWHWFVYFRSRPKRRFFPSKHERRAVIVMSMVI